jgi:hypothetical protein
MVMAEATKNIHGSGFPDVQIVIIGWNIHIVPKLIE